MFRQSRNSVQDVWGTRTPYDGEGNWPQRVDEQLDEEPQHWVQSACVLCANGCALDIGVKDNRIVGVRGRGVDRSNRGRLGPKGLFGWRANHSPDRLMHPAHVRELARRWNVDPLIIPHWHTHAHALEIFRHAETGSIQLLWITATNPAVSLPELHRIRKILRRDGLFVVVQDAFLTETAQLADVVLPAAIWGEKTGTLTNADRTVHISHKAIDPPGEARADLDILLDFARRMDFRDKDGQALVKWSDAEGAFHHWKEATQAAQPLRDRELLAACRHWEEQNKRQLAWLNTEIMH